MPKPRISQEGPAEHGLLLNAPRAASYLGLSRSRFYEMSALPGFPSPVDVPLENQMRWRREDLRAWVRSLPSRPRTMSPGAAA